MKHIDAEYEQKKTTKKPLLIHHTKRILYRKYLETMKHHEIAASSLAIFTQTHKKNNQKLVLYKFVKPNI